jgi:acetyl/propionyl-CoA carboxylase alpha subunit
VDYDPLLGKLIVSAADRGAAIARMHRALDEYYVSGIKTNVGLLRRILGEPDFINCKVHTRWLDEWLTRQPPRDDVGPGMQDAALAAALAWHLDRHPANAAPISPINASASRSRRELDDRFPER